MIGIQSDYYNFSKNACLLICCAQYLHEDVYKLFDKREWLVERGIINNNWEVVNIDNYLNLFGKRLKIVNEDEFKKQDECDYGIIISRYEYRFHCWIGDKNYLTAYDTVGYCKAKALGEIDKENIYLIVEKDA